MLTKTEQAFGCKTIRAPEGIQHDACCYHSARILIETKARKTTQNNTPQPTLVENVLFMFSKTSQIGVKARFSASIEFLCATKITEGNTLETI